MRRTAEEAERTRLALLEAALMAFEEKGWRGATFEHVAARAGLTRGAVHHHFASKAALLSEALEQGWAEYGDRLFAEEATADDPASWIAELLSTFVRLLREDDRFRALASTTVMVAPQALVDDSRKQQALDDWRERIAGALSPVRGTVPAGTTAGLVLVLLQGFTVTAVTRPHDLPQPIDHDVAIAALVRGLLS